MFNFLLLILFAIGAYHLCVFLDSTATHSRKNSPRRRLPSAPVVNEEPNIQKIPFSAFAYTKVPYFFTKNEYYYYRALSEKLPDEYLIFPKVRVADVVTVRSNVKKYEAALYQITNKHFDFLILSKKYLTMVLIVELNDNSHKQESRSKRDDFLNALMMSDPMRSSNLKILFVEAVCTPNGFDYTEAVDTVLTYINQHPLCPRCHIPLRIIKSNSSHSNDSFLGCPNYFRKENPCTYKSHLPQKSDLTSV